MVYAQSPSGSVSLASRERTAITVLGSIVLHLLLGWAVLHLLVGRTLPPPEELMTIEIAPPMAVPARAAPAVTTDAPPVLPERPRSELALSKPDPQPAAAPQPAPSRPVASEALEGIGVAAGPVGPPAAAPRPTYRTDVVYPVRAQTAERSGVAVVEVLIAAGGAVTDVRVVSESPGGYGFGQAALESVRQWRFDTAQPGVYRVTVRFTLD